MFYFDCIVKFHYLRNKNDLENVLEKRKLQSRKMENDLSNDCQSEDVKTECLIVMDDVSGVADDLMNLIVF